jgi:hypothetical protein
MIRNKKQKKKKKLLHSKLNITRAKIAYEGAQEIQYGVFLPRERVERSSQRSST